MTWSTVSIVQKSVSLLFVLGVLGGFYFYSKQVPGSAPSRPRSMDLRGTGLKLIEEENRKPFQFVPPHQKIASLEKYYVHFWSITCEPCLEEIPWLDQFTHEPVNNGAKEIWIHVAENNDETAQAKKFLEEKSPNRMGLFIQKGDLGQTALEGYPTHFLIDGKNRIAFEFMGRLEKIENEFKTLWLQVSQEP